ncbi:helix-turn-helix transcriptional regulator [Lactobacillus sp. LC28-10]|uniref:Helix-turn-helix transcriptional regulator n=1 Tax=Secundilactobacillus angelensis TaxID=2722706 RepID=A0ABX1L282_9LACO|nr:helix-turn-helix transcriptional regulator [Secundilactobacillus angelensis]MCH5462033.1 helix-turn-helix domain-containing protein [Secundilactobacillus angelensis]NLR19570.1 helix-turn-helix transcriptional regulator [Secundilactobacillus angelensis]
MNIERFIKARKAMGLSQAELCDGICTQATLSKFENSGKAPAIRILTQLCARLSLTLDDVFPVNPPAQSKANQLLDRAEFKLITSEYDSANDDLDNVDFDNLSVQGQMQYYFVKGYLSALLEKPIADTLYYFNLILNDLDDTHSTIFTQLAYTGSGIAYGNNNENQKSEFFFQKVFDELHTLPLTDNKAIWRALNMVFYTAQYFAHVKDYKTSDSLLQYGYEICANNHVTYYSARICFRRAQNAIAEDQDCTTINAYLSDAKAFARINNNQKLLRRIESTKIDKSV